MSRAWILQGNPKRWDIWSWWEDQHEDLGGWAIAIHTEDVAPGDDFALWISGPMAGVYAIGKIRSDYYGPIRVGGGYWVDPPAHDVYGIDIEATRYLFDGPILKADLASDPDFARALVLRMPGTANPIPLEPTEWQAIKRRVGRGRELAAKPTASQPVVSARPLGQVPEDITVPTAAQTQRRRFRRGATAEALPDFDPQDSASALVRLRLGNFLSAMPSMSRTTFLLRPRRLPAARTFVWRSVNCLLRMRPCLAAVLLPERPTSDLQDLLRTVGISAIFEAGQRFRTS